MHEALEPAQDSDWVLSREGCNTGCDVAAVDLGCGQAGP